MSKAEITATEKLLNLIREDAPHESSNSELSLSMEAEEINSPEPVPPDEPQIVEPTKDQHSDPDPIRRQQEITPPPPTISENKFNYSEGKEAGLFSKYFMRSKHVTVGIDIQPACINLVKFCRKTNELLACHSEPLEISAVQDTNSLLGNIEFKAALSRILKNFCGHDQKPEIWCSLSSLRVDLHNIIIPKVGESEIPNAVFWSTKKTVEFDEQKDIFDFSVLKELDEHGTAKILTLVTLVSKDEIAALKNLFKDIDFRLTGISYPPSATQNLLLFNKITNVEDVVVHLRIREENSFIDLFCDNQMIFSREIKTDAKSFIESCQEIGSNSGLEIDDQTAVKLTFKNHRGISTASGYNEIRHKIDLAELPVLERLTRQLNRTFEYCANNFKIPKINTICTSGEFILRQSILQEIQRKLEISCRVLPTFGVNSKFKDIVSCHDLNTAAGLALSVSGKTKNFLYTYADRQKNNLVNKINQVISIVTIIIALLAGGLIFQQYHSVSQKKSEVKQLTQQLQIKYNNEPRSKNANYVNNGLHKLTKDNLAIQAKIDRFQILAGLSELNKAIPDHVKLTSLLLAHSEKKAKRGSRRKTAAKIKKLWLSGYVSGRTDNQDFVLLNFIKKLSALNLANKPVLNDKKKTSYRNKSVIKFNIELTVKSIAYDHGRTAKSGN